MLFPKLRNFTIFTIIFCTLFSSHSVLSAQKSTRIASIVIKIREGSPEASSWLKNGRTGAFKELLGFGTHTSRGFVGANTLQAVRKRVNEMTQQAAPFLQQNRLTFSDVASLERIAVLDFLADEKEQSSTEIIARKLSTFPFVEYAEPLQERKICAIPNDPMIQFQYFHDKVQSFAAWDALSPQDSAVVAIVDTGIDYEHEDLSDVIAKNSGEMGLDSLGRDKKTNGLDDDRNGFVDDWRGWDFAANGSGQDNDPRPGNTHGTHVAGIVGAQSNNSLGVAGVAKNVRLLAVKVGADDPGAFSVINSYDGVLYAAALKADIINCSWGGFSRSDAEQEIINAATKLGSLVVGAAGNDGMKATFYPAGYSGVMSVASTNTTDFRSAFSNYDITVDVSAPGSTIFSTITNSVNNKYDYMSGTSMAAPVASGVAALVKMKFKYTSPDQIQSHVKATTDNIDAENPDDIGLIGTGRVNAFKALSTPNPKAISLISVVLRDQNGDGIYDGGEDVQVILEPKNIMPNYSITNGTITARFTSTAKGDFIVSNATIGALSPFESRVLDQKITFRVPNNVLFDATATVVFDIFDGIEHVGRDFISFTVNPSYKTFSKNNITLTINSRGNFMYNDYPTNKQGDGIRWKNSSNLSYEGGIVAGTGFDRVSDVVRSADQSLQDNSFRIVRRVEEKQSPAIAQTLGTTEFSDISETSPAGINVVKTLWQPTVDSLENTVFVRYHVTNMTASRFDSLYVGFFADWDLGPGGQNNFTYFDERENLAIVKNIAIDSLPHISMQLHTNAPLNFWAIDNPGNSIDNPGIYNGFTKSEKWRFLRSGIGRDSSSITDISTMIAAGPITLAAGDTTSIAFSISARENLDNLRKEAASARMYALQNGLGNRPLVEIPSGGTGFVGEPFPNPMVLSSGNAKVSFGYEVGRKQDVQLRLVSSVGQIIQVMYSGIHSVSKHSAVPIDCSLLSSGVYFIEMICNDFRGSKSLIISR